MKVKKNLGGVFKLDDMDAAVIYRADGRVELVLPDRPKDEIVPLNCKMASLAAIMGTDKEMLESLKG